MYVKIVFNQTYFPLRFIDNLFSSGVKEYNVGINSFAFKVLNLLPRLNTGAANKPEMVDRPGLKQQGPGFYHYKLTNYPLLFYAVLSE